MGVWSVCGSPDITVIRNTVMFNMVEIPSVIFSPDSAGIRNTNLEKYQQINGFILNTVMFSMVEMARLSPSILPGS